MKSQLRLIGMLLVLPMSAALAEDCSSPQTQLAMNQCAAESLNKSDAGLNRAYGQIKQRLKGDHDATNLLIVSERSWVTFRDAECKFASVGVVTGSIYPMIFSSCLDRLTKARTAELKIYLNCEEGDMGCPVPPAN